MKIISKRFFLLFSSVGSQLLQNIYVLSENTLQHHSMPLLDSYLAAFVVTYYRFVQHQLS
jgi:hypothetical protein